ncbi:MAG: polyphosphate--glucose phosphotransferase [Candidatus Limnocylindrales bacterium]
MNKRKPASDQAVAREYPVIPASAAVVQGHALGIDIGGTGIKAAVVDVATGHLVSDRMRQPTPQPPTPAAVLAVVGALVQQLTASGALTSDMPAGAGFPSAIRSGHALTAPHGEVAWVGQSVEQLLGDAVGRPVTVLNDSDAAGVAEVAYGAGRGNAGVVLLLDLGTGIGTTLFTKGELVPNMQLGHIDFHGHDAESRVSPAARRRRNLGWKAWGRELNELLAIYEEYLWPDLIILGGGLAKDFSKFSTYLETKAVLIPAALGNLAGIAGAARVGASAAALHGS